MFFKSKLYGFLISLLIISIILSSSFLFTSCIFKTIEKYEETREMMGTFVTITIYSSVDASDAINEAFDRISSIESILTIFDENSHVSYLNKNGYINQPPEELVYVMNKAITYYHISEGAFDITIQPVLSLWQEGLFNESIEVQEREINQALELVGSDKILMQNDRIEFLKEGMQVTFGGIAKGYAVDEAIEVLKKYGVESAIVNAGGDLKSIGRKPDKSYWVIALENPDNKSEKIETIRILDRSVTTSGNYERYFSPDKRIHHIIDPRTGFSANLLISATIISDMCIDADALSTAAFVLGPQKGLELIESMEDVDTLIIDNDRQIIYSSNMADYF
jgi:FAD:protein FMN transferase